MPIQARFQMVPALPIPASARRSSTCRSRTSRAWRCGRSRSRTSSRCGTARATWRRRSSSGTPPRPRSMQGNTFYVPDMRGLPALTAALSAYQTKLHGRDIPVIRSTITPGGMQAVYLAMQLVADVGTNVVYVEPQWPNIRNAIHVVGAEPRPVPLRDINGVWSLDLDAVFKACDARTRAIAFSTPSNPLGWTASLDELRRCSSSAARPASGSSATSSTTGSTSRAIVRRRSCRSPRPKIGCSASTASPRPGR